MYHDGCDLKPCGSPRVMAQRHPGERGFCGAHHSGGTSLRTLGPTADPEIFAFSGLRDSTGTAPNGICCFTEHSGPKYTQPPNPAHWSDPSHGSPRGPGPPREGEDPDQSEVSSEESGVDQALSKSEAGYHEDGNHSFLSIPSACNCQGTPGIPRGPYSEGDGSSRDFCDHCTSPSLGEDEELEEEYDDEEPLKFPSEFSRVSSGEQPPSWRQRHRFLTKKDNWGSGCRDPRDPGRHRLGRKRSQTDKRRAWGWWGAEELCQLGQAGFWWLIELLVLVGEYVETCGHLIYACRQLKASDLELCQVWVGAWAGRLGGWAQLGWQFLVGLGDWLGWRDKAIRLFSWLDSPTLQRCFTLLRDIRQWQQLPEEEVARLLTMAGVPEDEINPFHVVGVEATASDTEIKKAYRQLAVMVHPDKNHHPRAEEAFKVLRAAWDIVSNPERWKEYERKKMAEKEVSRSEFDPKKYGLEGSTDCGTNRPGLCLRRGNIKPIGANQFLSPLFLEHQYGPETLFLQILYLIRVDCLDVLQDLAQHPVSFPALSSGPND
ncbi:DnaJ-like protein subfamily C member 14 [Heterocephalus glaber]|uniref:DnaJ-like protein subfamily C member 14 n=1 Tax=Heterocephalus glaber TaxID=10181 RepID=G5BBS8_HETGA|nr:DnaJ-like protein subfamily C member 14 [Heterocephalus glaber]